MRGIVSAWRWLGVPSDPSILSGAEKRTRGGRLRRSAVWIRMTGGTTELFGISCGSPSEDPGPSNPSFDKLFLAVKKGHYLEALIFVVSLRKSMQNSFDMF